MTETVKLVILFLLLLFDVFIWLFAFMLDTRCGMFRRNK